MQSKEFLCIHKLEAILRKYAEFEHVKYQREVSIPTKYLNLNTSQNSIIN